jgi:protein-S-isoprenylcysteine O-methyltransferase Ste14
MQNDKDKTNKKILPPIYFFLFLFLAIGLHFIFPVKKIIQAPYTYSGIALIVFGVVLNIWSDALFKKKKTTIKPFEDPTKLEVSGPFAISRNPMYLGMAIILLGTSVFLGSLIAFIFPIGFIIVMSVIFIPFEEQNLEKIFGKEYLDYKQKVRCWI